MEIKQINVISGQSLLKAEPVKIRGLTEEERLELLKQVLTDGRIPWKHWSRKTKGVGGLHDQLEAHKASLMVTPEGILFRRVFQVQLTAFCPETKCIWYRVCMKRKVLTVDGSEKHFPNLPGPMKKIRTREHVSSAVRRCLLEEIGYNQFFEHSMLGILMRFERELDTFPGLNTERVNVRIATLLKTGSKQTMEIKLEQPHSMTIFGWLPVGFSDVHPAVKALLPALEFKHLPP